MTGNTPRSSCQPSESLLSFTGRVTGYVTDYFTDYIVGCRLAEVFTILAFHKPKL